MSYDKRYQLLAVDDQVGILQMIKTILRGSPFDVVTALNGEEALAQAVDHDIDVVLLDIMMPDVSGIMICGQLRAIPALADVPIAILTAVNDYALHQRAKEVGNTGEQVATGTCHSRHLCQSRVHVLQVFQRAAAPDQMETPGREWQSINVAHDHRQ